MLIAGLLDVFLGLAFNGMRLVIAGGGLTSLTFLIGYGAPHRGFWHSIPVCLAYGVGVWWATGQQIDLGVLAATGFYSHLVLDKEPLKLY